MNIECDQATLISYIIMGGLVEVQYTNPSTILETHFTCSSYIWQLDLSETFSIKWSPCM